MIVAIASGKGGTGKTTLAVNLASSVTCPVQLLDCDVEEPNCHLFLNPQYQQETRVTIPVPQIDESLCTHCGACADFCAYGALASLPAKTVVFPELCHGCGGCTLVCPERAIEETDRGIGLVKAGMCNGVSFAGGELDVGRPMAPPVIRAVKKHAGPNGLTLLDCPPGTACPMVTAVRGADYVVLVTEPTPFGLHDLRLAVETVREIGIPFGVVINRAEKDNRLVDDYCEQEHVPVLLRIPNDQRFAEAYSRGQVLVEAFPELQNGLRELQETIAAALEDETGQ